VGVRGDDSEESEDSELPGSVMAVDFVEGEVNIEDA
jgi:hypothetical protein